MFYFYLAIVTMEDDGSVQTAVTKLRDASLLYTPVTLSLGFSETMLCVAHLPLTMTEWMFRDLVATHGSVDKCFLMRSVEAGKLMFYYNRGGRSGSVVECLTRDRGAVGSSLTGVTVLCP